jgi:nucleoside-diphosphate-sugar epimerase
LLDIVPVDINEYPENVRFIFTDVRNLDILNKVFKEVKVVIHTAAALPLCKKDNIFSINIGGTRNVLEAAKTNKIERVVFISSTAVYGTNKKYSLDEDADLAGVGPYGESKVAAEEICLEYRKRNLCVPILRPKSFIGTKRLGVFQILYDWVESGKRIPIIGNGKNRFQLLAVEDLVDAIYLVLTGQRDRVNDTFNIGAEDFKTVYEDVSALCAYASTGSRVLRTPKCAIIPMLALFEKIGVSPLYKWVYMTAANDSFVPTFKIKYLLGWLPRYSNVEALIKSYQWYLDHKSDLCDTGTTHRLAWKQGILKVFKAFL